MTKPMDPTRMRFSMSAPRRQLDDDDNSGLNCHGCIFRRQKAAVCKVAGLEAVDRGMRDCDAVDQFGEVVVYVPYNQVQPEITTEEQNEQK